MAGELKEARRAAGGGRIEEALVYLWNAVEPARLAGDESALEGIARLAAQIQREGDPGQQREAARLLQAAGLREPASPAEAPWPEPSVEEAAVTEQEDVLAELAQSLGETEGMPTPAGETAAREPEAEKPEPVRRRSLGSLLVTLLVIVIVLVNVLARVLGDR